MSLNILLKVHYSEELLVHFGYVTSNYEHITFWKHSNRNRKRSRRYHQLDMLVSVDQTSVGHVFGNFPNYYSFHSCESRMNFLTRDVVIQIWNCAGKPKEFTIIDIGCNEGDLSLELYLFVSTVLESFSVSCKLLGVDLDPVLIDRAIEKTLTNMNVTFLCYDIMNSADNKLTLYMSDNKIDNFTLVTAFSVTMWIHLNHNDDGLIRFLKTISQLSKNIIIEPQKWKSYSNAAKRCRKLSMDKPKYFDNIQIRDNVENVIIKTLTDLTSSTGFVGLLGIDTWKRSIYHICVCDDEKLNIRDEEENAKKKCRILDTTTDCKTICYADS